VPVRPAARLEESAVFAAHARARFLLRETRMAMQIQEFLLTPDAQAKIAAAIEAAQERASVEFHVHVEATSRYPEARAEARAGDLLRAVSARRPAMLLYLLTHERRCYIATDKTLRPLEGARLWRDVADRLTLDLLHGKFGDGLADAVGRFSHIVGGHFPASVDIQKRAAAR
jgi:uncharacterized membrane protein